jgi:hypothetical protein
MAEQTYIDENGYIRKNKHSNLVHRKKAHKYIYLPNKDKYKLPFSKYVVHHKDRDIHNNKISNLELLTPEEHERIHKPEIDIKNIEEALDYLEHLDKSRKKSKQVRNTVLELLKDVKLSNDSKRLFNKKYGGSLFDIPKEKPPKEENTTKGLTWLEAEKKIIDSAKKKLKREQAKKDMLGKEYTVSKYSKKEFKDLLDDMNCDSLKREINDFCDEEIFLIKESKTKKSGTKKDYEEESIEFDKSSNARVIFKLIIIGLILFCIVKAIQLIFSQGESNFAIILAIGLIISLFALVLYKLLQS